MFISHTFRRILALTTAISLVLPALPAAAQTAADATPPTRVGQIAAVTGNVSYNGAGAGGWAAATANYPVATGDSLYTQPGAQAVMALDSSTVTLAENTEIQITGLTDANLAATESLGEMFLAVTNLPPGETFTIATPRGTVNIGADGQYDIAAGDANSPTVVAVFQGAATVTDPGATVQVAAGQAASLTGTDQTVATLGEAAPDDFARRQLALTITPPPAYVPPVATQMTGTYELGRYGDWDQNAQYGAVWYPRVDAGWAPYREGHWADIRPWGWTWVDNAPWGFAPFHYGRWVDDGGRWGWTPAYGGGGYGPGYRPVYAPAVVGFFGLALAAGITAAALSRSDIGWVPLGPNEPYYPSYRASPDYIRRINAANVRNIDTVNIHETNYYGGGFDPGHFANRRAATTLPADAMARGEQVGHYGRPVGPDMFHNARPIDMGFGAHPQDAGGGDVRLPMPDRPLAAMHPGAAPHPSSFADRKNLPPAMLSHEPSLAPAAPRPPGPVPGLPGPVPGLPGMGQPPAPPHFSGNPGYHAPPPPPFGAGHALDQPHFAKPDAQRPPAPQEFHPYQPQAQPFHPPAPRPPMPQVFQPRPEPSRPAVQNFHPQQMQQPRPQPPAFQPPHVQAPPPPPRPEPPQRPEPQHPNKQNRPQ